MEKEEALEMVSILLDESELDNGEKITTHMAGDQLVISVWDEEARLYGGPTSDFILSIKPYKSR